MHDIDKLIISLKVLRLELDLESLDESESSSIIRETFDLYKDIQKKGITISAAILPDKSLEFLVKGYRWRKIKIKIDGTKNHMRPHIHVDIDGKYHVVSIALDNTEVLAGEVDSNIPKLVSDWIVADRELLTSIWRAVQEGKTPNGLKRLVGEIDF